MDIVLDSKNKQGTPRKWWIFAAAGAAVIILFLFITGKYSDASYIANRKSLLYADVERGSFNVSIRGFGTLVPKEVHWISSDVQASVKKIWVKPGDSVSQGDTLLTLHNPQLVKKKEETEWELEALIAEKKAEKVALESKLLELKATVINTELEYENARLKLTAETSLIEAGNTTVSKLEYEKSKLTLKQFEQKKAIQRQQFEKMEENLDALNDAAKARLNKMRKTLQQVQSQVAALEITATSDGIVQEMNLELGQQVAMGDSLLKIAQLDNLIAEIKVQELQIQNIERGQRVTIDTRSSQISGIVARIDPAVIEGTVLVDVELQGQLPSEARPDLSVEGVINVSDKADTLFVKRPVFASGNSQAWVYRVNDDNTLAERVAVNFGQASTNTIEIVSGLQLGDQIIISDQSAWENHQQILIN